ncbi:MAG: LysM peptidoglycan-binding domain-containing protein [Phycisphaerae bacterium]
MYEMRSEVRWGMLTAFVVIAIVSFVAIINCNKQKGPDSLPFDATSANSNSGPLASADRGTPLPSGETNTRPVPSRDTGTPRLAPSQPPPSRPIENRVPTVIPPRDADNDNALASTTLNSNANELSRESSREADRVGALVAQSDDEEDLFDPVGRSYEDRDEADSRSDTGETSSTSSTPSTSIPDLPRSNPMLPPPNSIDRPATTSIEKLVNPATGLVGSQSYTIQEGDTLSAIAAEFYGHGKYYLALAAANPDINPNVLIPGQSLVIPDKEEVIAGRVKKTNATAADTPKPADTTPTQPKARRATYRVGDGDTLEGIARKILGDGDRWPEIYNLNKDRLKSPDVIPKGMDLRLPEDEKTGSGATNRPANTNANSRAKG